MSEVIIMGGGVSATDNTDKDHPPDFNESDKFRPIKVFSDETTVWTVPEAGWYRVICIGASGRYHLNGALRGAHGSGSANTYISSSGRGASGTGGIAVSDFWFEQGESYQITATRKVESFGGLLQATTGNNGGYGHPVGSGGMQYEHNEPGKAGTATGGNNTNLQGLTGGRGGTMLVYNYPNMSNRGPGIGQSSPDGHPGQPPYSVPMIPSSDFPYQLPGCGGYTDYPTCEATSKYFYKTTRFDRKIYTGIFGDTRSVIDKKNNVVIFGVAPGWDAVTGEVTPWFDGCVIIEKYMAPWPKIIKPTVKYGPTTPPDFNQHDKFRSIQTFGGYIQQGDYSGATICKGWDHIKYKLPKTGWYRIFTVGDTARIVTTNGSGFYSAHGTGGLAISHFFFEAGTEFEVLMAPDSFIFQSGSNRVSSTNGTRCSRIVGETTYGGSPGVAVDYNYAGVTGYRGGDGGTYDGGSGGVSGDGHPGGPAYQNATGQYSSYAKRGTGGYANFANHPAVNKYHWTNPNRLYDSYEQYPNLYKGHGYNPGNASYMSGNVTIEYFKESLE